MGVLPNSQFGDVAVINVENTEGSIPSSVFLKSPNDKASSEVVTTSSYNAPLTPISFSAKNASTSNIIPAGSPLQVDLSGLQSQFTVLALRQAEALQRWKEISQSGDSDYREQIRKHFGVNLPQALSNMCTYIGGISRNLDISEVVNNNLAAEGDTAVIAGRVSALEMVHLLIQPMNIVLLCAFITLFLCLIIRLLVKTVSCL